MFDLSTRHDTDCLQKTNLNRAKMLGDAEDDDFILNDPAEKFIIQPRKPVNAEPQFKRPLKR